MNALLTLQAKLESEGYQVGMQLLAPGSVFGEHCRCETRIGAVFSGELKLVIDGQTHTLGPGDWIEIPAGVAVSAEVLGDEPVLELDAVRGPPTP
jgi:quercetin dioxygenase-like cupin family protein